MNITHLMVLLDNDAPSFCYYQNIGQAALMEYEILKKVIAAAKAQHLIVNFIYGAEQPPKQYDDLINSVEHVKIVPLSLLGRYPEALLVLNSKDRQEFSKLPQNLGNIILRLSLADLAQCADFIQPLVGKFKRLNLCLLDIDSYRETDFRVYQRELKKLAEIMAFEYKTGKLPEINIFTDRMLLQKMNNCGAGEVHLTVAPNGRYYLCPGFYYKQPEQSLGDISSGFFIKNSHLNSLEYAPICRICDSYHCKRCIFLNKTMTGENNTPSSQQCVLSHLERDQARILLADIQSVAAFEEMPEIPKLDYLDPFLVVSGEITVKQPILTERHGLASGPDENSDIKKMLQKIYDMQLELMRSIQKGNF